MSIEHFHSKKEYDHVYYNFDIINGRAVDKGLDKQPSAQYNETRDTPIISDSSKYDFSIVRFTLNGSDKLLPILIPRIKLGQSDPDLTEYAITFKLEVSYDIPGVGVKSNGFISTKFIKYKPQSLNATKAVAPIDTQDITGTYYYVYDFYHWVGLVNETFDAIVDELQNDFEVWWFDQGGDVSDAPELTEAPHMIFDEKNKTFDILYNSFGWGRSDSLSFSNNNAKEDFRIFFNSNMYGLFSYFEHKLLGGDETLSNTMLKENLTYEIIVRNRFGSNIYRPENPANTAKTNTPSYFRMSQAFPSTSTLWSPISSIVFVSTLLPVLNEQTGQPITFGADNIEGSTQSSSSFQPIITDIALSNESANAYNQFTSYVPSAEYRLSALSTSPQEIRNIDVQVYFKERLTGRLIPLKLFNLSTISIKIMFRKKLYN